MIRNSEVTRLVVLGASNLTLGLESVRSTALGAWGSDIEILATPGYGRSYGAPSRIAFRTLPGILECGLWSALRELPSAATRAVVTDVGNDILYGVSPGQVLEWVEEAMDRLLAYTREVVVTDLPMDSVRRLSSAGFLIFRTLFFPSCRLSREEAVAGVDEVNERLIRLAATRPVRLVRLKPHWYAIDPIHIRPAFWSAAWRDIILGEEASGGPASFSTVEWGRLQTLAPERRWLFGIEQVAQQSGQRLRAGGRLWLY